MNYAFIKKLNKKELEKLCSELVIKSDSDSIELLRYVKERLRSIEQINKGLVNFSSDRIPYYDKENEERCYQLLDGLFVFDFPFLKRTFYHPVANRARQIPLDKILLCSEKVNLVDEYGDLSLTDLERFFESSFNIYYHEGTYNILNYIKNYVYRVLSEDTGYGINDLFFQYEEKVLAATDRLNEITEFLRDTKAGTNLCLSFGNRGLNTISTGTVSFAQKTLIEAVAFGTSLEQLEQGDFEDCKRLLFLPRKSSNTRRFCGKD